jgi:hypothetical protein
LNLPRWRFDAGSVDDDDWGAGSFMDFAYR